MSLPIKEKMSEALLAEKQNKVVLAAKLYEEIIEEQGCPALDCFVNLFLIYFVSNDPGERQTYNLTIDFTNECNDKMDGVFDKAKKCYPNSQEILFWENYINFIVINDPSDIDPVFSQQRETLVPFFCYFKEENDLFYEEAKLLYEQIKEGKTCKERYMKSVLDGKFSRRFYYKK